MEKEELKLGAFTGLKAFTSTLTLYGFPIGVILAEFFEIKGKLDQIRVNKLVDELNNRTTDLETKFSQKLGTENFENFVDIFREAIVTSTKTSSENKHKALTAILIENLETENSKENYDLSLTFIRFVNEFTENHLLILKYLYNNQSELAEIGSYNSLFDKFTNSYKNPFDKYEFKFYCEDLRNKGLISMEAGLKDFDDKSMSRVLENHKNASVFVTSFGNKFISYLLDNKEVSISLSTN